MMTTSERIHQIMTIVRKELHSTFETPIAYIVTILFVVIADFLFFRSAFLVHEASLSVLTDFIPWLLMFVVPALTMGTFATEREIGTYETLATRPLSEWEILGGKFVATVLFLAGMLALVMAPIAISFSFFGNLDLGVLATNYLASVFLAAEFAALGIFLSSLFSKQVTALLTTIAAAFGFIVVGLDLVTQVAPVTIGAFLEQVSALTHYDSMVRGVIDSRDLWYFVSVIAAFLILAQYRLLAGRFARGHAVLRRWRLGITLVALTVLISNVLGASIPGRLDLTADHVYTLSAATTNILHDLPDVVNITLYASAQLPARLQPVLRDARDLLKDYARYGGHNVVLSIKNPDNSQSVASEAESSGVQPVQFNTFGQGEVNLKKGYLGIAVTYGGQSRAIPFFQKTDDLEYQLTTDISELTTTNKKTVAFTTGHGESAGQTMTTLRGDLQKLYKVTDVALSTTTTAIATDTAVLVIDTPTKAFGSSTRAVLATYLANGGSVLALLPSVTVDERSLSATPNPSGISDLFATDGVMVNRDIVYDLARQASVGMQGGQGLTYYVKYPFMAIAMPVEGSPITIGLQSVLMPWASSLSINTDTATAAGVTVTPLVETSPYAGVLKDQFTVTPDAASSLSQDDLSTRTLAVSIAGTNGSAPRAIVVGDGNLFGDQYVNSQPDNAAFLLASVAWLAQDVSLASIKIKSGSHRELTFGSTAYQTLVQYGDMGVSVLIPLLIALYFLMRRKNLKQHTFSSRKFPPQR